ncbi:MAG: hypothetical protein WC750_04235 [Patescibacteria group bacterium]|jgi:hypothetical protein
MRVKYVTFSIDEGKRHGEKAPKQLGINKGYEHVNVVCEELEKAGKKIVRISPPIPQFGREALVSIEYE